MTKPMTFKGNPEITFTRESARDFAKLYEESVIHGNEVFKFQGHDIYTLWAKYVIEYLVTEGWLTKKEKQ